MCCSRKMTHSCVFHPLGKHTVMTFSVCSSIYQKNVVQPSSHKSLPDFEYDTFLCNNKHPSPHSHKTKFSAGYLFQSCQGHIWEIVRNSFVKHKMLKTKLINSNKVQCTRSITLYLKLSLGVIWIFLSSVKPSKVNLSVWAVSSLPACIVL